MANKGRIYLNVDLKNEALKEQLDALVAQDARDLGESSPSVLIRKLIRRAYFQMTTGGSASTDAEARRQARYNMQHDSHIGG